MAGFVIGDLVRGFVTNGATRVGLDYARALANLVYAFILVLVLTIAISTLGVDTTLIRHTVEILLLGGAIATALALGLGMRPLAWELYVKGPQGTRSLISRARCTRCSH